MAETRMKEKHTKCISLPQENQQSIGVLSLHIFALPMENPAKSWQCCRKVCIIRFFLCGRTAMIRVYYSETNKILYEMCVFGIAMLSCIEVDHNTKY